MNKTILQILASTVLTISLSSAALAAGGGDLESNMKHMASSMKSIAKTINDPAMNTTNSTLADKFVAAATFAKGQLPEGFEMLQEPELSKRKALYEEMMDHAIELGGFLSYSLKQNDQAKALRFLEQIRVIQTDGHKEFKAEDLSIKPQTYAQTFAATDLKSVMKNMGVNLKLIIAQASDRSLNQSSAKLADDFVAGAKESKAFIPASISQLPADQQTPRATLYSQMTDKLVDAGTRLSKAFSAGDNAAAQAILGELSQMKKDGHYEFN
jgi:hypothetical protein